MKRIALVAVFLGALAGNYAVAATLDEINDPLLKQNQWRVDAGAQFNYNYDNDRIDFLTTASHYNYDVDTCTLVPDLYYGITDHLQLALTNAVTLPSRYKYTDYSETLGPQTTTKNRTKYLNSFGQVLTFRPDQAWEFYLGGREYFSKRKDYASYSDGTDSSTRIRYNYYTINTGFTWLSRPQAGEKTLHNRADLDGLLAPLLDAGQVMVELPVSFTLYDNKSFNGYPITATHYDDQDTKGRSYSFSLLPEVTCGLPWNIELALTMGFYPPSLYINQSHSDAFDVTGSSLTLIQTDSNSRMLGNYAPTLRLTQRPHPQLQWYFEGSYGYSRYRYNFQSRYFTDGVPSGGSAADQKTTNDNLSGTLNVNWITRPQKEGVALTSDMDGLKHPLLERNQFKLDGDFTFSRGRYKGSNNPRQSWADYSLGSALHYGILDNLAADVSLNFALPYRVKQRSGAYTNMWIYPLTPTYGCGLTSRPMHNLELFCNYSIVPRNIFKLESRHGSTLSSVDYSATKRSTVNIGATILW